MELPQRRRLPKKHSSKEVPEEERIDTESNELDSPRGYMNAPLLQQDERGSPIHASYNTIKMDGDGEEQTRRIVYTNKSEENLQYMNNEVITSKYTIFNFLFKFLWTKFGFEVANQYFLLICILQSIPAISITGGIPTTAAPLAFVLFVDGFFTAIQDYNRHVADRYVNIKSKVEVIRDSTEIEVSWRDVMVGDIVKVRREERFPCDMLCLGAVHDVKELGNKHRRCHVNTKDLDGENNLKMRRALAATADKLGTPNGKNSDGEDILLARETEKENDEVWHGFYAKVNCDLPNGDLDRFSGQIEIDNKKHFVEADNLLLRSTQLRNCSYVYGLAIYTGYDTKINYGGDAPALEKSASLSGNIDRFVIGMFTFQFALCAIGAALNVAEESGSEDSDWYLDLSSVGAGNFFLRFFTFFLLMSQLVPISLYVSIKISRQAQKYMMDRDSDMALFPKNVVWRPASIFDEFKRLQCCNRGDTESSVTDDKNLLDEPSADSSKEFIKGDDPRVFPTEVRTMDLNDELGQITHVFSDKTGTLTCNDFQFRQMSIGGQIYGKATTQIGVITARAGAKSEEDHEHVRQLEKLLEAADNMKCEVEKVKFYEDRDDGVAFKTAMKNPETRAEIECFLYNLALDHTVEIEPSKDGKVKYSSASPDEESFAYAAKFFGYEFKYENEGDRYLSVEDPVTGETRDLRFRVLALLPFSSARGMMSVIVQDLNVEEEHPLKYVLYSKGADNAIGEKLYSLPNSTAEDKPEDAKERKLRIETEKHIKDFGADGLRAMAFSMKPLDKQTVDDWLDRWSQARSIHDEEQKKEQMKQLMDEIEQDQKLQGATAIEDRLQDDVAETIATLSQANIKIYMLTGDKEETAINIGYGVNMLTSSHERHILTLGELQREGLVPEDEGDLYNYQGNPNADNEEARLTGKQMIEKRIFDLRLKLVEQIHETPQALVVDKDALQILLDDQNLRKDLCAVTEKCASVICCRCRPKQKRSMLMLVKETVKGSKCLAIGDGANDVEMINASNVGVGILGAEGSGAANSSDYKIPQFKVLKKLLLVHGRWNYIRMATLIAYMFYKNALFTLAQFWFSIFTMWSGQKFYIELATQTFNLVYTGLPILLVAILDQDVDAECAQLFPHLYRTSQSGRLLNMFVFILWVASGAVESLVIYFFSEVAGFDPDPDGYTLSVFQLGSVVFTAVIVVVSARLAAHTAMHHWLYQIVLLLCVIAWPICAFIFDALDADGIRGGMGLLWGSSTFWLLNMLILVAALLPLGIWMAFRKMFYPSYASQVREAQLFIKPSGQDIEFDSVFPCQYKLNRLIEDPVNESWERKKNDLLKLGVRLDAHYQVEQIQKEIQTFNLNRQKVLAERIENHPHMAEFKQRESMCKDIPLPSETKCLGVRQNIVKSNLEILEQFGKVQGEDQEGQSKIAIDRDYESMASPSQIDAAEDSKQDIQEPTVHEPSIQQPRRRLSKADSFCAITPADGVRTGRHRRELSTTDFAHDSQTNEDKSIELNEYYRRHTMTRGYSTNLPGPEDAISEED